MQARKRHHRPRERDVENRKGEAAVNIYTSHTCHGRDTDDLRHAELSVRRWVPHRARARGAVPALCRLLAPG
eukprot:1438131-Alexandrium_andersonii.AAC.1